MQRRFLPLWACTLLVLFAQVGTAGAASYLVAPVQINGESGYSYLEKALPPMLSSRLFWESRFEPVPGQDAFIQSSQAPKTADTAEKARVQQKADYIVWGSVTIMGDQASLDINVTDGAGKNWQKAVQTPLNNMLGGVQAMTNAINSEVFGRPLQNERIAPAVVTPVNPDFVMNESQPNTVYLNPQFRYQGEDNDRVRSQRLEVASNGMEVADVNGDGKNEILLFDEDRLYAYHMENGQMRKLGEQRLPSTVRPLLLRSVRTGGRTIIVMSGQDSTSGDAQSMLFTFINNQFHVMDNSVPYYLNVVKTPPLYEPMLIGQTAESSRVTRGPIFEVLIQGDSVSRGGNLSNLPREANVFNFAWVPGNQRSGGDYLAAVGDQENLLTFDSAGTRLAKSEDKFSGGNIGLNISSSMQGMGTAKDSLVKTYYVPIRMIPVDLDKNGSYELLVSKPVTTAGEFFNNYRTYSQGEIHSLVWDGIGMDLIWKTRRIRGTVIDLAIADADNDGVLDLAVNVNTYPGALGVGQIRSVVTLYPLDLSMTSSNTQIAPDDF